ncbi:hypothetical protein [Amycolatopsis minnesotensis]|uniref:WD40 repeat domain-containing protein n=1 Tax=Amycolatopsis minnesotensis TaxID=337894 RepID=UPI0031E48937
MWDLATGQATASVDTTVRVRDVATRRTVAIFKPHGTTPGRGLKLAGGSTDPVVRLWDLEEERAKAVLFGHTGYITSLAFSPDGRTLASAGPDRAIRLWSVPVNRGCPEGTPPRGHSNACSTLSSGELPIEPARRQNRR